MTDIIDIITEKLVRRHPHIFQKKVTVSIKEVEESWENIKNKERPLNNSKTPISDRLKLKIRPQPSTKAALIISKKVSENHLHLLAVYQLNLDFQLLSQDVFIEK